MNKETDTQITIIGGGSMFVAGILQTLVKAADEMAGTTVVLQDIDPQRMELMCTLGKNLVRAAGADLTITSSVASAVERVFAACELTPAWAGTGDFVRGSILFSSRVLPDLAAKPTELQRNTAVSIIKVAVCIALIINSPLD